MSIQCLCDYIFSNICYFTLSNYAYCSIHFIDSDYFSDMVIRCVVSYMDIANIDTI